MRWYCRDRPRSLFTVVGGDVDGLPGVDHEGGRANPPVFALCARRDGGAHNR